MATTLDRASNAAEATDPILNVAAYKFTRLSDLQAMRDQIRRKCLALGVRGTVLLAPEGINLFLAGSDDALKEAFDFIRSFPQLSDLEGKYSRSAEMPFRRMLVRLKKEIIPFGLPDIKPHERTSPKLPPRVLKRWLDEGRRVRLLDVRNKYEVELGTFDGAEHLDLDHFREFVHSIEKLPEEAKDEPVVMFCTGGIRCEKAGPLLEKAGFRQVYQLEGGILKYFEECGGAHYHGSCFVFDGRVALDPQLRPTGAILCFNCQAVLSSEDVTSGKFMFGQYCPNCYEDPEQEKKRRFAQRRKQIRDLANAQPGCKPYDHVRPIYVPRAFAGMTLIDFLSERYPGTPRQQWQEWIDSGRLTHGRTGPAPLRVCTADEVVNEGQAFFHHLPDTVEPPINPDIELLYEDDWLVAVSKPAPLPVHPSGRYHKNTLTSILSRAYPKEALYLAHRLDANTTGVVVLARRHHAAKLLSRQFAERKIYKEYYALLVGHPDWDEYVATLPVTPSPVGEAGRRASGPGGRAARTRFEVLARLSSGQTLVRAEPHSGRTNQIRVHAWALGFPIVGDPLYLPDNETGCQQTLGATDPPMCLHAASLSLEHPVEGCPLTLRSAAPAWLKNALQSVPSDKR